MKLIDFIVVCGAFGLLFSCARPNGMYEEPVEEKESEEWEIITDVERTGPPPVFIDGGINIKELYADMPNTIKVYAEGGSTEHLHVFSNSGRMRKGDASKGLYSFTGRGVGTKVEIVAKDTVSGQIVTELFDIVAMPAPDAYVWKYRTMFKNQLSFTAEEFKAQNAVILQHDIKVPVLCLASSYTLLRIDGNGKRTTHDNKNSSGLFDEESKKMVAAATKGDVYVVQNIKTVCSPFPIKNIVYVIQ